jgi:hypothetical protein
VLWVAVTVVRAFDDLMSTSYVRTSKKVPGELVMNREYKTVGPIGDLVDSADLRRPLELGQVC